MSYHQVETLLNAYEKWVINDLIDSYFTRAANPILNAVKLLDHLHSIQQ